MRDTMVATGLEFKELDEDNAVKLGWLSAVQRMQRGGRLGCPERTVCWAAAKGGHLEMLQWAQANGCPWSADTCKAVAEGGHLGILQWVRTNGCLWGLHTRGVARGRVLEWALANGVP